MIRAVLWEILERCLTGNSEVDEMLHQDQVEEMTHRTWTDQLEWSDFVPLTRVVLVELGSRNCPWSPHRFRHADSREAIPRP